ncbi:hypothetical protein [Corynebacterium cystitidis]|uniref:Uncharacterized protein n=1 Tax=Corynebacterium cystitidis DSM 20524 TaxID=1121357 RepID=A0A1H9QHH5_9CORY|nr:hypothetical protein [Corynebacterium cystitidis]WJY81779.1 hypothetical protein CCYS_04125 [Corynebacterium cystitidis DSM 20524]SER59902.1 hypothetical protein SAMN05661109_00542 [Corynebacterium cystitidis DSM 20524]SNV83690.1 DNA-directed RNA polymerase II subunit [Corynebacterium cystitidis]
MKDQNTRVVIFTIAGLLVAGLVGWLIWITGNPGGPGNIGALAGSSSQVFDAGWSTPADNEEAVSSTEVTHLAEPDRTATPSGLIPTAEDTAPRPQAAQPRPQDPFLPPNAVVDAPQGRVAPTVVYRPTNVVPIAGAEASPGAQPEPSASPALNDDAVADSRGPRGPERQESPATAVPQGEPAEPTVVPEPGQAPAAPAAPAEPAAPAVPTAPAAPAVPAAPTEQVSPAPTEPALPEDQHFVPETDDDPAERPAPAPVHQESPNPHPSSSASSGKHLPFWQKIKANLARQTRA